MVIPAYMSKKIGKPVMMRISRAEEYYLGSARNAFQGNIKVGFDASGKLLAADVYVVQDSGAHISFWDYRAFGDALALVYQPKAMRWRGVPVFCNAPTRSAQRGPGQNQLACVMEPLVDRAARDLKIDRVEIRKRNNPVNGSLAGGDEGKRGPVTSAYIKEALDKGRAKFNWDERKKKSGQRNGPRVTGIGVGQAFHPAGFAGFDGLLCLKPDGKLHIHTGVGNLGTFSHSGTSRIAAEVLKVDWENCVIERGDSRKNLPWNIGQFGSNTSYTMTRTNYVAAQDMLAKLKEIAAQDLGGKPDDYDVDGTKVFAKANPSKALSYGDAAKRAIALGGKFDGHELPKDINPDDPGFGHGARRPGPGRRRQGQPALDRAAGGLRRLFHRDRTGRRDRHASHRRPGVGGRLRHGDSPDGPRHADQGRRGAGHRHGVARAAGVRSAERACRPMSGSTSRSRLATWICPPRCSPTRWTRPIHPTRWAPRAWASR